MSDDATSWHARATANIRAAGQRSGRLGTKKSRAGCLTCKTRRIKCDERHPRCSRCATSNKTCEWPRTSKSSSPGSDSETAASSSTTAANGPRRRNANTAKYSSRSRRRNNASTSSLVSVPASSLFGLSASERRKFDYFLSSAAPKLGGTLDRDFWCGYALQLAQAEPLVLDSVLAIATLYEHPQYMSTFRLPGGPPQRVSTSRKGLREQLEESEDDVPQEESTRVNVTTALMQKDAGKTEFDRLRGPPPVDTFHAEALRYYNRAMRRFRQRMDDGTATPLLALMSCVLFICIETIRDSVPSTMSLFSKGVEIIRHMEKSRIDSQEEGLIAMLKETFVRLSIVAATFGFALPAQPPEYYPPEVPPFRFNNMVEARTSLYGLMRDIDVFVKKAYVWKTTLIVDDEEGEDSVSRALADGLHRFVIPASLSGIMTDGTERPYRGFANTEEETRQIEATEREQYQRHDHEDWNLKQGDDFTTLVQMESQAKTRLSQWYDAVQTLLNSSSSSDNPSPDTSSPSTSDNAISANHLLMFYHHTWLWAASRLSPYQAIFDTLTPHFEAILQHAEHYVKAKRDPNSQPVFTFEVGAVPPLYFVATKCRVPSLRRRALDLMRRAPLKEAIWGARSTAEVASRLVEIEEEGLGLPQPDLRDEDGEGGLEGLMAAGLLDDDVRPTEAMRIHSLEMLQHCVSRAFDVRVTRFVPLEGGRLLRKVEEFHVFD